MVENLKFLTNKPLFIGALYVGNITSPISLEYTIYIYLVSFGDIQHVFKCQYIVGANILCKSRNGWSK